MSVSKKKKKLVQHMGRVWSGGMAVMLHDLSEIDPLFPELLGNKEGIPKFEYAHFGSQLRGKRKCLR